MQFSGPRVVFNEPAMQNLLDNPQGGKGTVGAHMKNIGLEILVGSKAMVGVKSGHLRTSIRMRQGVRNRIQYVEVGSNAPHALVHHEGAKPHVINPTNGRVLRFNVGGMVVYARKVNHPGNKPNNYLTVPMRRAVRGRN